MAHYNEKQLRDDLTLVYGADAVDDIQSRIDALLEKYARELPADRALDERDAVLITYGDSLTEGDRKPFNVLTDFVKKRLKGVIDNVHVLPFQPFSSDDGFSVIDYYAVNPELGSWDDVRELAAECRLMADAVVNHASAKSQWFKDFLGCHPDYDDYFAEGDPEADLSEVVRPRQSPLLTPFKDGKGETRHIWTTFSDDQIDFNYRSPRVLIAVLDVLLNFVKNGARMLRLDAVTFLWKEPGTSSVHMPETHALVRLMRNVVTAHDPHVIAITETNVPHHENISYFGDGHDEAHMVYNFALPPLLAYSLISGNGRKLSDWAKGLDTPSDETCFFNFTASHDGVGVRASEGILTDDERGELIAAVEKAGGFVSSRATADGGSVPYELNCNYLDLVSNGDTDTDQMAARFIASQAVAMSLPGVPAIYIHSLLGSQNDRALADKTGRARSINRAQINVTELDEVLANDDSLRAKVFAGVTDLLKARRTHAAFHPMAPGRVLDHGDAVFAMERQAKGGETVTCLVNLSDADVTITLENDQKTYDLVSGDGYDSNIIPLQKYGILWLKQA